MYKQFPGQKINELFMGKEPIEPISGARLIA